MGLLVVIMKKSMRGIAVYIEIFVFSSVTRRWRGGGESIDGSVYLRCVEILACLCMDGKA